jgi:hypothetical protein
MHEQWLDLIPYYVNRTLPETERAAFERHLAACETCRRALEEWHTVAGVVHAEADRWAREAPALSARFRVNLGLPASSNGHGHYRAAFDPNETFSIHMARRSRRIGGRVRLPLTLAAAMVILTFGALLLVIASQGHDSPSHLSAEVEAGSGTPTNIPHPATLGAVTATLAPVIPTPTPDDLGILPLPKTPTPLTPPGRTAAPATPFPFASPVIPTPTLYWPPTPSAVYQYGIGSGYVMVTTGQIGAIPVGTRVRISHASYDGYGWVYYILTQDGQSLVEAHEWQLSYAPDVTPGPTPTAYFGALIGSGISLRTTEQVGAIPAGTRVRIGSAWFDGMDWYYSVVAEDGFTTAEARTSQLTYDTLPVPAYSPTPTPTAACPYSATLTGNCPITQKTIPSAYQPFENGIMVWRGDTHAIYVLYKSGSFEIYPDTWIEGETLDVGETPPAGTVQPTRGFGKVWATQPGVRAQLGWALGAEAGYAALWETHAAGDTYFNLPDGRVVHQTLSGWEF